MKKITKSAQETKNLGKEFSSKLKPGDTVLLYGDLGSGKTTFVQGIAQGFGIKDRILSPTFLLQRVHVIANSKAKTLNHIDLYRIEKPSEIESLGLQELFESTDSITIIEWADRIRGLESSNGYKAYFSYINQDKRELKIEKI